MGGIESSMRPKTHKAEVFRRDNCSSRTVLNSPVVGDCANINDTTHVTCNMTQSSLENVYFPPEMVEKILKKSMDFNINRLTRKDLSSFKIQFGYLIRYRQVSPEWRDFVDEILESDLLSLITSWRPNRSPEDYIPDCISTMFIAPMCMSHYKFQPFYSSFINTYMGTSNPFPGRSLVLTSPCSFTSMFEKTVPVDDVFVKFGYHISVLCLVDLSLHADNFISILESCKNLKALIMCNTQLFVKSEKLSRLQLPSLPMLTTLLQLRDNYFLTYGNSNANSRNEMTNQLPVHPWLFRTLCGQLQNLEIYCTGPVETSTLTNLKQLSIVSSSLSFLHKFGTASSVQRLSVSSFALRVHKPYDFVFNLFKFIDNVSNNIVELYLNTSWFHFDWTDDESSDFDGEHDIQRVQELRKIKKLISATQKIHSVEKLTVHYPNFQNPEKILTECILPKFPSLRSLVLLSSYKYYYPQPFYHPDNIDVISPPATLGRVWQVCTTLQTVSIVSQAYDNELIGHQEAQFQCFRPETLENVQ